MRFSRNNNLEELPPAESSYIPDEVWNIVHKNLAHYGRMYDNGKVCLYHKRISNAPEKFALRGPFGEMWTNIVHEIIVDLSEIDVKERPGNHPKPIPKPRLRMMTASGDMINIFYYS